MSWRDTLAASLGHPLPDSEEPKTLGQTPMDKLDNMDTNIGRSSFVHTVHSVHRVQGAEIRAEPFARTGLYEGDSILANVKTPAGHNPPPTSAQEFWACWCCGGRQYFLNTAGQPVCARCHPPVDPIRFPIH